MRLLTRKAQAALDTLQVLAKEGKWTTAPEIAKQLYESPATIQVVLKRMSRRGFVINYPGRGYMLSALAYSKSAYDFVKLFDRELTENALRGDFGASNRLLKKFESVLVCTGLDELIR